MEVVSFQEINCNVCGLCRKELTDAHLPRFMQAANYNRDGEMKGTNSLFPKKPPQVSASSLKRSLFGCSQAHLLRGGNRVSVFNMKQLEL